MSKVDIDASCFILGPDGTPTDYFSDAYVQAELDENGDPVDGAPMLWTLYGASGRLAHEAPMWSMQEADYAVRQSSYPDDEKEALLSLVDLIHDAFEAHAYAAEEILALAQEKGIAMRNVIVYAD